MKTNKQEIITTSVNNISNDITNTYNSIKSIRSHELFKHSEIMAYKVMEHETISELNALIKEYRKKYGYTLSDYIKIHWFKIKNKWQLN